MIISAIRVFPDAVGMETTMFLSFVAKYCDIASYCGEYKRLIPRESNFFLIFFEIQSGIFA
jgi:hypothetical protein